MASTEEINITTDVVIPCIIILGLFIINGIIFLFIMRKRRQIVYEDVVLGVPEDEDEGIANANATDNANVNAVAAAQLAAATLEQSVANECAIEMERL